MNQKVVMIFMFQKIACLLFSIALFCTTGCKSSVSLQGESIGIVEELGMRKVTIEQCRELERSHNYSEAMKKYVELLSQNRSDRNIFEQGTLGKARSFYGMKKYTYALNALSPLPDKANTDYDRRKLVLAGEIMLSNSMHKSAESVLELALSHLPEDEAADFATVFANLGTIYLKNYKLNQGIAMFRVARKGFKAKGELNKMAECDKILNNFRRFTAREK